MNTADLIRMANQIAAFHAAYPAGEAIAGTARHITDFWDPRMRARLARLVAEGGEGLAPVALAAARQVTAPADAEAA
jgi:formate dehydrogenase subunit delta